MEREVSKLTAHVGSARDMGRPFSAAFERAAEEENFEERHVTFLSLQETMTALMPKRLELLRYLHRTGAESVKALARELGRDYKRVHEDVAILERAGLIVREDGRLSAPWEALTAEVSLWLARRRSGISFAGLQ
jgi:predicted transcriptional regulator